MKKIISVLVCFLLVFSLSLTAFAADIKLKTTGNEKTVKAGDTVTVKISVTDNLETGSLALSIEPSSGLSVSSCKITVSETKINAFDKSTNKAVAAFEDGKNIKGEIAVVELKVDSAATGNQSVTFTVKANGNADEGTVTANINLSGQSKSQDNENSSESDSNNNSKGAKSDKNDNADNNSGSDTTDSVDTKEKSNKTESQLLIIVIACVCVLLIILFAVLLIIKAKGKKTKVFEKEIENEEQKEDNQKDTDNE